jgi:hypothetical protein
MEINAPFLFEVTNLRLFGLKYDIPVTGYFNFETLKINGFSFNVAKKLFKIFNKTEYPSQDTYIKLSIINNDIKVEIAYEHLYGFIKVEKIYHINYYMKPKELIAMCYVITYLIPNINDYKIYNEYCNSNLGNYFLSYPNSKKLSTACIGHFVSIKNYPENISHIVCDKLGWTEEDKKSFLNKLSMRSFLSDTNQKSYIKMFCSVYIEKPYLFEKDFEDANIKIKIVSIS